MPLSSVTRLLSMGCVCGRESVTIKDRKFFVKSRLGEGGFSYVDLVEDARSRKLFALKRIVCHSDSDETVALKEVSYMQKLNHPSLVGYEVHDKIVLPSSRQGAQSEILLVMPFYRKGSIWDEVEFHKLRGQHMAEERVVILLCGICDALLALHHHHPCIAHRDVKPHNVMIGDGGGAVLMDFGSMAEARVHVDSSKQARAMQDMAAERCTMPYRAPELFNIEQGSVIDESVDIWSLGCTLYAMCFHESPFDEVYQKGGSIALAVLSGKIHIPERHSYSSGLVSLILSMLSVESSARPDIDRVLHKLEELSPAQPNRL